MRIAETRIIADDLSLFIHEPTDRMVCDLSEGNQREICHARASHNPMPSACSEPSDFIAWIRVKVKSRPAVEMVEWPIRIKKGVRV
ncbi:MAG TPA: hypothetical protein VKV39_10850 [Candidatus Sulfotelmatobacter sp.]|nr:hypothetical protein [Candidatus Sulfotelmatobacter sp.]